jgi:mercuric ion transport protein
MHGATPMTIAETKTSEARGKTTQALAATGLAAGLLASSCCLLPLILVSAGIGGAWMSRLTALAPYQPVFLSLAAIALGWGFWRSYRRQDCAPGSSCERPGFVRTTRILLWLGAALVLTAVSIDILAPLFW